VRLLPIQPRALWRSSVELANSYDCFVCRIAAKENRAKVAWHMRIRWIVDTAESTLLRIIVVVFCTTWRISAAELFLAVHGIQVWWNTERGDLAGIGGSMRVIVRAGWWAVRKKFGERLS